VYETLLRTLEFISTRNIDDVSVFGLIGEQHFAQIIAPDYVRANPIVPHPDRDTRPKLMDHYLEADFLLYTRGVLFCIEIKRWRGTVAYVPGCGSLDRCPVFPEGPCSRRAERCLLQIRPPKGERVHRRGSPRDDEKVYHRSPLDKTTFIRGMKKYLARPDIFDRVPIKVIALFDKEANIDDIVRADGHIGAFMDYADMFARHGMTDDVACPASIREQLERLPTWDWMYNYHGDTEPMKGILVGTRMRVIADGRLVTIPYREIQTIKISTVVI